MVEDFGDKGGDCKLTLHEILKYKLNNLHVLIFLHVVCFYFTCYSSILVGANGLLKYYASPVQCRKFRKFGGGGGSSGKFRNFKGDFQDPGWMRIYGGWQIFRIQGGWFMSDNEIFHVGSDPRRHYGEIYSL